MQPAKPAKVKAKPKFTMQAVKSASLAHIGHHGDTLRVTFGSGKTYDYEGVTAEQFEALSKAESVGGYFQKQIRDKFMGKPVE